MLKHRFSLVACARWEETQIQEWVEYHKSIGFDHVYLYSNDDDPAPLFHAIAPYAYGPNPLVTFRYWPHLGEQSRSTCISLIRSGRKRSGSHSSISMNFWS